MQWCTREKDVKMKKNGFTLVELVIVMVFVFGIIPYVMNVVRLVSCDFKAPYKAEAVYGIGLFTPTYLITGFMSIDDGVETKED